MNASVKSEATMKSEVIKSPTTTIESPAVSKTTSRVLKIATCPSLSGKSTLTYHIGFSAESEIQFRVVANTNIGFFSPEWVAMRTIQNVFDEVPLEKTITSFLLHALFRGKSVNTPAFLFAVLMNEGLVKPAKDKQRQYERIDPKGFLLEVKVLIASGVDLKWDEPAKRKKVDAKPTDSQPKTGAKSTKVDASPSKTVGSPSKVDASPSKPGAKSVKGGASPSKTGVQLAKAVIKLADVAAKDETKPAVVEPEPRIINAAPPAIDPSPSKIDPMTERAIPTKKATTKASAKAKP